MLQLLLLLWLLGVCLLALACRLINCASVINVMISQCKRIFHVIQFVAASSSYSYNSNNSNRNNNSNGNGSQSICIAFLPQNTKDLGNELDRSAPFLASRARLGKLNLSILPTNYKH